MDCSNIIGSDYDGDGQPALYATTKPRSRRQHKCCECRRIIEPGELYLRESGLWDGMFQTFKTCRDCQSVRNSFLFIGHQYGMMWEDLEEHIRECKGEVGSLHITCLTPKARARVCDLIENHFTEESE